MTDLVRRELDLPAPPEEVWDALTDPDRLSAWLADEVSMDLVPGGEARFRVDGRLLTGWVEEARAPVPDSRERDAGRLAFWWSADGEPASRVEISLERTETGTVLRVTETRPLDVLDLVGIPLPGAGGATFGPALVAA